MSRPHPSFAALRESIFAPPPAKRARGGRPEMRVAGNPDVFKEAEGEEPYAAGDLKTPARGKRRSAPARSGKSLGGMTGQKSKHRPDKRPRGGRQFADGGSTGGMPYGGSGMMLIPIPQTPITPGRGAPPAPAPYQDNTLTQLGAAGLSALGHQNNNNSNDSNWKPDLGYAVYSNGTPIGIKGVAPFAGGPDDISVGARRGGRIKHRKKGR
jgi:hypothetical protein